MSEFFYDQAKWSISGLYVLCRIPIKSSNVAKMLASKNNFTIQFTIYEIYFNYFPKTRCEFPAKSFVVRYSLHVMKIRQEQNERSDHYDHVVKRDYKKGKSFYISDIGHVHNIWRQDALSNLRTGNNQPTYLLTYWNYYIERSGIFKQVMTVTCVLLFCNLRWV